MAEVCVVFDGTDFDTINLILTLHDEEIECLRSHSKDKNRDGELDDYQLALSLLEQNFQEIRLVVSDRQMTQSIATAVQTDGQTIADAIHEEETACDDRAAAHQLNGSNVTPEVVLRPGCLNVRILSKLAGQYMSEDIGQEILMSFSGKESNENTTDRAETSAQAPVREGPAGSSELHCDACRETKKYFDVLEAPCGHGYCKSCLQNHFDQASTDESLFPPRCCRQPIDVNEAQIFLTKELRDKFERAKVEFSSLNRTYCSQSTCSAFIPSNLIQGDTATCLECGTATCVMCKAGAHEEDCPEDDALHETLALADESGWQRCYSCRRLSELEVGCNHMSCRCGAQFCYVCGSPWKECACLQWCEDRLLARANHLVDRDMPHMAPNNPVRVEAVSDASEMLRNRHDCTHTSWRYIPGTRACEECFHTLPEYIFECRQCRLQACNRCRRNRL